VQSWCSYKSWKSECAGAYLNSIDRGMRIRDFNELTEDNSSRNLFSFKVD